MTWLITAWLGVRVPPDPPSRNRDTRFSFWEQGFDSPRARYFNYLISLTN